MLFLEREVNVGCSGACLRIDVRRFQRKLPSLIDKKWRDFSGKERQDFITTLKMGNEEYPEIQGGGSLILAWQIRNKRVLVVGGGEVSLAQGEGNRY